jgi:hypothetical protein
MTAPRTKAGLDLYRDTRSGMTSFPDAMRSRILAIEREAAAQPAPLTREALAAGLRESGLIDRLQDYGEAAHQIARENTVELSGVWADAILAALPPAVPEPIDVERLAEALRRAGFEEHGNRLALHDYNCATADCAARAIAAAYARSGATRTPAEQRARPWTTAAMDAEEHL